LHVELPVQYVSVAVPVPFLDRLTYSVPDHLELPVIGARVRVPVGSRTVTGCVVQQSADASDAQAVKDIVEVLDREPFLPPGVVKLCEWVAEYYLAGIGDAVAVAMPPGARVRATSFKTRQVATVTAHGLALSRALGQALGQALPSALGPGLGPAMGEAFGPAAGVAEGRALTPKQRAALDILAGAGVGIPVGELRDRGVTRDVLARLVRRGLVTVRAEAEDRDPFERAAMPDRVPDAARDLTPEQRAAFEQLVALVEAGGFRAALLHGVTGSGKTEIYLRLAQSVQRADRQVLLLVPEIALTPSVTALFRGAFGDRVAIQHSALSDGERHDQWHRIRRGDVDLVIGTRSAVFAPLTRLGLIVVDEEHDTSYKQEEAPRYHGRDVAIVRATHEGALVVLGSATPSMETYQNAVSGKYTQATMERRVLDRPLAAVRIVNMRAEYAEQGPDVIISRDLAAAVADRLARREQVLVLLNRRGYATAVFCRQCGDTFECPNCTISLTVHRERNGWRARCHYCNFSMMVPKACRKCAAPYLERAGFGTEKVEEQLTEAFPQARISRVDRDSVRRKGALASLLGRFATGEIDILVGTQMIAKGHDFPRVTLVGVVSADVGLGLADFRAAERTFQLLTQVAGRAGRGERSGEAIVQTLYPEHYSIQLACRQDYRAFFERELAYRRGMRYPPMVALINTIVRGRTFEEAMQTATEIVRRIEPATAMAGLTVLGPAPAPLVRLRGEHRVQFLLKGTRRADMRRALQAALAEMPQVRRRITVDVDPLTVL
jgi:primosomal protein N' (replication factor Y) (superfamily II helicase)